MLGVDVEKVRPVFIPNTGGTSKEKTGGQAEGGSALRSCDGFTSKNRRSDRFMATMTVDDPPGHRVFLWEKNP